MTVALRYLSVLFLSLCLLAPQATGVLAGLGLADGRAVVICTGDGLRTMRLDAEGAPVELSESAEICSLAQALDTAAPPIPGKTRALSCPATSGISLSDLHAAAFYFPKPQSRAPPYA